MDVRNMSAIRDKDFDVVFDKGTLDCLYVNNNNLTFSEFLWLKFIL